MENKKELFEYEMVANLCVETEERLIDKIHEEIMDAIIHIVEKYESFVGGGIHFEQMPADISAVYEEEKNEQDEEG